MGPKGFDVARGTPNGSEQGVGRLAPSNKPTKDKWRRNNCHASPGRAAGHDPAYPFGVGASPVSLTSADDKRCQRRGLDEEGFVGGAFYAELYSPMEPVL